MMFVFNVCCLSTVSLYDQCRVVNVAPPDVKALVRVTNDEHRRYLHWNSQLQANVIDEFEE